MLPTILGFMSAFFAAISALFWALSARVNFKFGWDSGDALNQSMKKASKLNATAAAFTSAAAVCSAAAIALPLFGF
ncbi:hypothetical protein [Gallaecimonas sp. GXIMD4217]|uniref:hypothetical protein n=1 Tax=Gallaecimonas sp. GXIMD4217 TaxID=3131927 RepID=UPI00311B27CE